MFAVDLLWWFVWAHSTSSRASSRQTRCVKAHKKLHRSTQNHCDSFTRALMWGQIVLPRLIKMNAEQQKQLDAISVQRCEKGLLVTTLYCLHFYPLWNTLFCYKAFHSEKPTSYLFPSWYHQWYDLYGGQHQQSLRKQTWELLLFFIYNYQRFNHENRFKLKFAKIETFHMP